MRSIPWQWHNSSTDKRLEQCCSRHYNISLIIFNSGILSRMLLIKHIRLKFNSVVTINVESLDDLLCLLNTNGKRLKFLLTKKNLKRNGETQARLQLNELLRGESSVAVVAVDLLEKSLHDLRHLGITRHLNWNKLFCTFKRGGHQPGPCRKRVFSGSPCQASSSSSCLQLLC